MSEAGFLWCIQITLPLSQPSHTARANGHGGTLGHMKPRMFWRVYLGLVESAHTDSLRAQCSSLAFVIAFP